MSVALTIILNSTHRSNYRGEFIGCHASPPGGDQGLLNLYWSDWATKDIKYHLPFIYNVVPNVTYGYAPAYQR